MAALSPPKSATAQTPPNGRPSRIRRRHGAGEAGYERESSGTVERGNAEGRRDAAQGQVYVFRSEGEGVSEGGAQ